MHRVLPLLSLLLCVHGDLSFNKLVLLSRHGIRTPFPASNLGQSSYAAFSKNGAAWPETPEDWGAAGYEHLTEHGAAVLRVMGKYFRGWVPFNASAATSTLYADDDSAHRDLETAQNFMTGFGFSEPSVYHNASCTTWLFNQGAKMADPSCGLPSKPLVDGTIGGDMVAYTAQYKDLIMGLSDAIDCCNASVCGGKEDCTLMDLPITFNPTHFWSLYDGPFSTASVLAELISLMYANGMDTKAVAPGLDAYQISRLMEVHAMDTRLGDSMLITAQAFGSQLIDHISRTIVQLTSGESDPTLLSSPSDNLVYYAAHDINLYFLRAMLRMQWQTEGYNKNMAPPGSMLGFQLMQDPQDATWYVKTVLATMSMEQMRGVSSGEESVVPDIVPVIMPECYDGPEQSCAVGKFKQLVARAVRAECLTPLQC